MQLRNDDEKRVWVAAFAAAIAYGGYIENEVEADSAVEEYRKRVADEGDDT